MTTSENDDLVTTAGHGAEPQAHPLLLALLATALVALYAPVLARLWSDWMTDANYAHGVLVPPFVAWVLWRRRVELRRMARRPSYAGAWIVAASLALFLLGHAAFELFITRLSLLGVIAGAVVQLYGWRHLRVGLFPLCLLGLAIPLPALVFNEVAFPMQLLASQFGVATLDVLNVPAVREGNIIQLQNVALEVAEACSGIRSLISLGTLALVYGYLTRQTLMARSLVGVSVFPVVVAANGLRVAGAGIVAHAWGADAAAGFLHSLSGWLFFGCAVLMLVAVERLATVIGWPGPPGPPAAVTHA